MKKWIATLLTLCLLAGILTGCGESGQDINDGGQTGSNNQSGSQTNDNAQPGDNTGTTDSESNEDAGEKEDATSGAASDKRGEQITEAIWKEVVAGSYANYSYTKTTDHGVQEFYIAGEQWHRITREGDKLVEECGAFMIDGKLTTCEFDLENQKWVTTNNGYHTKFPLADFPFAFADLRYNEQAGTYSLTMPGLDQYLTQDQIANGEGDLILTFRDGKCIRMYFPNEVKDGKMIYWNVEFFDYDKTVIQSPQQVEQGSNGIINSAPSTDDPKH